MQPDLPGDHAPVLTAGELAVWDQLRASTSSDWTAHPDRMRALYSQLDMSRVRNAITIPVNAGEWAEGLHQLLRRVRDGYGRSIGCGPGWYPILVELDQALARIDPTYLIYQVKEKFGGLRYSYSTAHQNLKRPMDELVAQAEGAACRTCETTGAPGAIRMVNAGVYKTLNPATAPAGYEPAPRPQIPGVPL